MSGSDAGQEPFWKPYWKQIVGGFVATLVGTVGVVLSPIGPAVQHWIFPESLDITVKASAAQVRHNEEFSLTVIARPTSLVAVGDGQVELEFDRDVIRYVGDGSELLRKTPKIEASTDLFSKPPRFRAIAEQGNATVTVRLTTSSGNSFAGGTSVQIIPALATGRRPTRENFVGEWVLQIGDLQGLMKITSQSQEGHGKVGGSYELGAGSEAWGGTFDSITKDGDSFFGSFNATADSTGPRRMTISAAFCLDADGYIKIRGMAKDGGSSSCRDFTAWAEAEQGEKNCPKEWPKCPAS
jgi:hypothetical protein